MRRSLLLAGLLSLPLSAAQSQDSAAVIRADSLRGFNTPERAWWDVAFYDLQVRINPADSTIRGVNHITYRVVAPARQMQIDLQTPLLVDSFVQRGQRLEYRRDGSAWLVQITGNQPVGGSERISVY